MGVGEQIDIGFLPLRLWRKAGVHVEVAVPHKPAGGGKERGKDDHEGSCIHCDGQGGREQGEQQSGQRKGGQLEHKVKDNRDNVQDPEDQPGKEADP